MPLEGAHIFSNDPLHHMKPMLLLGHFNQLLYEGCVSIPHLAFKFQIHWVEIYLCRIGKMNRTLIQSQISKAMKEVSKNQLYCTRVSLWTSILHVLYQVLV